MAAPEHVAWSRGAYLVIPLLLASCFPVAVAEAQSFHLQEATIEQVHRAFQAKKLTATELLNLYLKRIAAYNGRCVEGAVDPATGLQLSDITPVENAGQLNALITLNLRGKRSKTDPVDNDPAMPDALEVARALDAEFARTGKLAGPLHGIPFAIKDQFDTRDMRSTSGAAANYANDRPPRDAEAVARLRAAGAIILAKSNMGEYATGDRSTFGGTTCNPYDTTRSAGNSSGGSGAAVAANLVLCALGEETGPSTRNPASNDSLVGIVPSYNLVSRKGLIPGTLLSTRDRVGVLCRTVKDAATVLGVIAGYDPKDMVTAASVGQMPPEPYESFAVKPSLRGLRVGVVREFMEPEPLGKAHEDSIRIANEAIADLSRLGAAVVDPGPGGQLFKDAIAEFVPLLDGSRVKQLFGEGDHIDKLLEIASGKLPVPPDATLSWLMGATGGDSTGEARFLMDRYLLERGDPVIKDGKSLIENSIFLTYTPGAYFRDPPRQRLESRLFNRGEPIVNLDVKGALATRVILEALILKVMADQKLDALVYPTKTLPAYVLAAPVAPEAIRAALGWTLSPASGFPAIVVPAGFTKEVYDPAVIAGEDGSKKAGELVGPKPVALPVPIEFLGRPFSEPTLIRIAAAYEEATHHRKPPKNFGPLPGEP